MDEQNVMKSAEYVLAAIQANPVEGFSIAVDGPNTGAWALQVVKETPLTIELTGPAGERRVYARQERPI